jgi:hypothetical protein
MQAAPVPARSRQHVHMAAVGVAATILAIAAAVVWPTLAPNLALAMSVPALAMAYLALVRARMLEFCPEVLGGDVILPRNQRPQDGVRLLLPLQFSNAGYADGIVEWIAVRVTVDGRTDASLLLGPVAEVDMQRFIHAKRQIEENTIEPFTRFVLEGRRAVSKFVLFDHAEKRRRGEPLLLRPGRYSFELFIKATNSRQPKLERTFEHVIEQTHLEDYRAGASVYLINYDISLQSARRSLAGAEWLPRDKTN